jgi:hypothetical protein
VERMNDELGPEARALLASYKRERPGQGARARNLQGVQRRVAPRSRPQQSSMKHQLAWGFAAAVAAALLLLVLDRVLPRPEVAGSESAPAGSQAVHGEAAPSEPARVEERPAITPAPASPPAPVVIPETPPGRDRTPTSRPSKSTSPTPAASSAESLAEETQLVARARAALARDDLDAAQAALDDHARRFANGALVEDRIAYATIVSCRRSEVDRDAKRREFLQRYPRSPHRPRIDEACG